MTVLPPPAPQRLVVALAAVFLLTAGSHAQQPRDSRRPTGTGAARISGVVVADDAERRPLRRVRVAIRGAEQLESARTTITDDDGNFAFEALPAGRYSLSASKDGYVTMSHGANRPDRPGRALLLGANETRRITLPLPKGSVITGRLLTPEGEAAAGVNVMALESRYSPDTGLRRLVQEPAFTVRTDDRGVYRIFGLPAGAYVVAAVPLNPPGGTGDIQVMSEREIRAALAEVRQQRTQARPGTPSPVPPAPVIPGERRNVGLVPVFYPGTTLQDRALSIAVRAAEVRQEVDFDLEYVTPASVEGIVGMPADMRVVVTIADADRTAATRTTRISTSPGDEGRFVFGRIPPGVFTITARGFPNTARTGAVPAQTQLWAETTVVVSGDDVSGIALDLKPALSVSGRLVFEGSQVPSLASIPLRLPLNAISATGNNLPALPSVILDGSTFSITGVVPGTYTFPSPPRGIRTPIGRWWLKSIVVNGRELLDDALDLRQSADDGVITFSDRASELSGAVRAADGTPAADGHVVVFAVEKSAWFHGSRRVAGIRPSADGHYAVRNLPPGEYLVAVADDLETNEWFDPEVLRALVAGASRIRLAENETRVLDLSRGRVGREP